MPFDAGFIELGHRCAPQAQIEVLAAVVEVQSGFDPLFVQSAAVRFKPTSIGEAVSDAVELLDQGKAVQLGLAGFEGTKLGETGLSVDGAFDACKSLRAAGQLLDVALDRAAAGGFQGDDLVKVALRTFVKTVGGDGDVSDVVRRMVEAKRRLSPVAAKLSAAFQKRLAADVAERAKADGARSSAVNDPRPAPGNAARIRVAAPWDVYGTHAGASVMMFSKQETRP